MGRQSYGSPTSRVWGLVFGLGPKVGPMPSTARPRVCIPRTCSNYSFFYSIDSFRMDGLGQ